MDIVPFPADEAAVRRYVEKFWLPSHRERKGLVDRFALADGVDLVAEEVTHRPNRHETERYRAWIADIDGSVAGFVTTELDESPSVFDRPDRPVVVDIYVRDAYRGGGLARELIARAIAFDEKLGFERRRHTMTADVDR